MAPHHYIRATFHTHKPTITFNNTFHNRAYRITQLDSDQQHSEVSPGEFHPPPWSRIQKTQSHSLHLCNLTVSPRPFTRFMDAVFLDFEIWIFLFLTPHHWLSTYSTLHSHDLFVTITLYLSFFDFNCLYYLDIFVLPRWKRHSGAGPKTHQRHTSTECTPHNTAAAPPSIIPESSYIHCNRQCTSTRRLTHISLPCCWTAS